MTRDHSHRFRISSRPPSSGVPCHAAAATSSKRGSLTGTAGSIRCSAWVSLVLDPAAAAKQLKLFWLSCGNQDGLITISQGVHQFLESNNVPHVWNVDDHAHDPAEWANNFYHFSQRVFK